MGIHQKRVSNHAYGIDCNLTPVFVFFFFNFRYSKGGVRGNNNIGIKMCTTNFLWVLNFGQVGEIFKNFQNHTTTVTFFKNGLQLVIFEKFTRDFPYKIEGDFF